jgi:hypothetical protein
MLVEAVLADMECIGPIAWLLLIAAVSGISFMIGATIALSGARNISDADSGEKPVTNSVGSARLAKIESDIIINLGERALLDFARTGDPESGRIMIKGQREKARVTYDAVLRRGKINNV